MTQRVWHHGGGDGGAGDIGRLLLSPLAQDGDDSEARRAKFFAEMAAKMRKDIARQE